MAIETPSIRICEANLKIISTAVYADNTYVSAYSVSVYIEDVEQQIVLNTDYKSRERTKIFVEKI